MKYPVILLLFSLTTFGVGQTLEHPWSIIDVGGGAIEGEGLKVSASVGQYNLSSDTTGSYYMNTGYLFGVELFAITKVVSSPAASGPGSLKQAILDANEEPGLNLIFFNVPLSSSAGGSSHVVIRPDSVLPEITDYLIIDGTTQPGYSGTPLVEIDGSNAGVRAFSFGGIMISAGSCMLRGLIINKFATDGVHLTGEGGAVITNCYIGTDHTGMADSGNAGSGIYINGSHGNRIGGSSPFDRNLISGNDGQGIYIGGINPESQIGPSSTNIYGNFIGVNASGAAALPNGGAGIYISTGNFTNIGNEDTLSRNVISGNTGGGILGDFSADVIQIQNNFIGTDATGMIDVGNNGPGISLWSPYCYVGSNVIAGNALAGLQLMRANESNVYSNLIGTDRTGLADLGNDLDGIFINAWFDTTLLNIGGDDDIFRNVISGNGGNGIQFANTDVGGNVISGNYIGVGKDGVTPVGNDGRGIISNNASYWTIGPGNTVAHNHDEGIVISNTGVNISNRITGNSVFSNTGLGIDLMGNMMAPDPNDTGDVDEGANGIQNFPEFLSVEADSSVALIRGFLQSDTLALYRLEFFAVDTTDSSGYGEGKYYLGADSVTTDGQGRAEFTIAIPFSANYGNVITATATDSLGNTSEFSAGASATSLELSSLTVKDVNVLEGNDGFVLARFSVDIAPPSPHTITMTFETVDGTASAAAKDYQDTTGTFTLAPFEESAIISVVVKGDLMIEGEETFTLRLSDPSNVVLGDTDAVCVITDDDQLQTLTASVLGGWNLVSLPLTVESGARFDVYGTAVSPAFSYEETGYAEQDTLERGRGYWIKFENEQSVEIDGYPFGELRVDVTEGWNLIGSIGSPVRADEITSDPPGLETSDFFEYRRGYAVADTLLPAKGYWVKASVEGTLILSPTMGTSTLSGKIVIVRKDEKPPDPPIDVHGIQSTVPERYALRQNYPNPFNPSTIVKYEVPVAGLVTIIVFDVLGREVETLVSEMKDAGIHTVKWEGSSSPSGVYYCRMTAEGFTDVKAMMLLK